MTIEELIAFGAVLGLLIGLAAPRVVIGCAVLLIVPTAMIVWVFVWQHQHPESIRSTSALDFVFVPLWPSLGAIGGYIAGGLSRALIALQKRKGS